MSDLDLKGLEILVTLGEASSLSAAARKLGIPVSTLSRRLQQLEASLGISLAARTTRHLRLTDVGSRLRADAQEALAKLASATKHARAQPSVPTSLRPPATPSLLKRAST